MPLVIICCIEISYQERRRNICGVLELKYSTSHFINSSCNRHRRIQCSTEVIFLETFQQCDYFAVCNRGHQRDIAVSPLLHTAQVRGQQKSISGQTIWLPGGMDEATACLAICFNLPPLLQLSSHSHTHWCDTVVDSCSLCLLRSPEDWVLHKAGMLYQAHFGSSWHWSIQQDNFKCNSMAWILVYFKLGCSCSHLGRGLAWRQNALK